MVERDHTFEIIVVYDDYINRMMEMATKYVGSLCCTEWEKTAYAMFCYRKSIN